ncbi:MAG: preprotein translocase subunit YajC [Alphaproteobacteria bacterium]|nr:preprotein translocase subunit YajC [Alphaproteobacteria bacterium]
MEETAVVETVQTATDAATQPAQQGSWGGLLLYCLIVFAVIYLFMVRPNKRRMAEYQKMIDSIRVGNRILAAGIYGVVKKIGEKTIEMEIAKGVVIEVSKNAVASVEEN